MVITEIVGLLDLPFKHKRVEWRGYVRTGEAWLAEGKWTVAKSEHVLKYCCPVAILVKLTGTDWLEAQEPGTLFKFETYTYVKVLDDDKPHKRYRIMEVYGRVPNAFCCCAGGDADDWDGLDECFPNNSWITLSDATCHIRYPRPEGDAK